MAVKIHVEANHGSMCGFIQLREGQICCNGEAHNNTNSLGRQLSCCGSNGLYDEKDKVCCGTLLLDKDDKNGQTRKCCSKHDGPSPTDEIFYTDRPHFCCDGIVKKLDRHLDINDYDCCGKALIDINIRKCCRSKTGKAKISLPEEFCCGADTYDNNTHWCAYKERVLPLGIDICGNGVYNVTSQVCCVDTGTVKSNEGIAEPKCEHGVVYDPKKYYVHSDTKKPVSKGNELCNNDEYSLAERICCKDTLHNISANHECCGSSYYSTISHECCKDEVFDPTRDICCNSNEIKLALQDIKCCGNKSYNTTNQVCCTHKYIKRLERPIPKKKSTDTNCCSYGYKKKAPYNSYSEECRQYGVVNKSNEIPKGPPLVPRRSRSPFCKASKKMQMEKTCENRRGIQGWVVASEVKVPRITTLTLLIIRPKRYRGSIATFDITVPAKCVRNWGKGFIWLLTNKRPSGTKRKNAILRFIVNDEDLLMKDTPKNRKLRIRTCKQKWS